MEERASRLEGKPRPGKELYSALVKVLLEKDIILQDEVRKMAERLVTARETLKSASIVARAWTDPDFEERFLSDAAAAAAEIDIATLNPKSRQC